MVHTGKRPGSLQIRKGPGGSPGNGQEFLFLRRLAHAVAQDQRQLSGGCGMDAARIRIGGVQAVGRNKISITAADVSGLLIHHLCESLHAPADMLRHGRGGIIMGFQHQGIQKILQPIGFPGANIQLDVRHRGGVFRHGHRIRKIPVFQGQDTGHKLRRAGHGKDLIRVFPIKQTAAVPVNEGGGPRIKLRRIARHKRRFLCVDQNRPDTDGRQKKQSQNPLFHLQISTRRFLQIYAGGTILFRISRIFHFYGFLRPLG